MRVLLLTCAALCGFTANSLLTRAAVAGGYIDAASFMAIRLVSGAATLAMLSQVRRGARRGSGSWPMALALAGYAVLFTIAYERITAGTGALLLFGSVQLTMFGSGLVAGERLTRLDWIGAGLAALGLVALTRPGWASPDAIGSALMAGAGVCWGAVSLAGRGRSHPLGDTTGNFLRASALGAAASLIWIDSWHWSSRGVWLAAASGSLASGVGYTLWYAVLPALAAWRAAVVQLTVPVLTTLAAAALLGEIITARVLVATGLVVTGIWLTSRSKSPSSQGRGVPAARPRAAEDPGADASRH